MLMIMQRELSRCVAVLLLGAALAGEATAQARRATSAPSRRAGRGVMLAAPADPVKGAFAEVVRPAGRATVAVRSARGAHDVLALGTIVGADGFIVTKASEIGDAAVTCRIGQKDLPAKVVATSRENDLVLLKIDAEHLPVVEWADAKKVEVGQWVASTDADGGIVDAGVIGVGRRAIPPRSGVLGISLAADGSAHVMQVTPGSPAESAGLRAGDLVEKINDDAVDSRDTLVDTLQKYGVGDRVALTVKRGTERLTVGAMLGERNATFGRQNRGGRRGISPQQLEGPVSRRAAGFAAAFQHDCVLKPGECGGPLVDVNGKVVGINIARAGRTESYAIPADVVRAFVDGARDHHEGQ